jgi:hypothetical protein
MSHNEQNSIVFTASGIFGGVGKAISSNHTLANISLNGMVDVAFYAAISAIVGYGMKLLIEYLKNRFSR